MKVKKKLILVGYLLINWWRSVTILKTNIDSYVFKSKQSMHNLISFNSLRPWMNVEQETSPNNSVDDYFECISECDVRDKSCVSHCRALLD